MLDRVLLGQTDNPFWVEVFSLELLPWSWLLQTGFLEVQQMPRYNILVFGPGAWTPSLADAPLTLPKRAAQRLLQKATCQVRFGKQVPNGGELL